MLVLNLLFWYLPLTSSFPTITSGLRNKNLIETMEQVLCSTDSHSVHLLASHKEEFHVIGVLIEWLNRGCSYRTIQLSTSTDRETITMKYQSAVTVFMVDSIKRFHNFLRAITRNEGNRNNKFLVVLKLEYDLLILRTIFEGFTKKGFFNVLVLLHDDTQVNIFKSNPFTDAIFSANDITAFEYEKNNDKFFRNRNDLRGRNLIVSMYEQNDRAVLKKNGRPGYTGMDGLIADLLEER